MSLKRPHTDAVTASDFGYSKSKRVHFEDQSLKRPYAHENEDEVGNYNNKRARFEEQDRPRSFSLLFRNPSKLLIAGPSMAGKTCFVLNFLRSAHQLFEDPRCLQNVIYFYNNEQDAYDDFREENIVHEWRKEMPTSFLIEELARPYKLTGGSIMVIDDFGQDLTLDTAKIFTQVAHHFNVTIFLLQQNIFTQIKGFRDISLNSTYTVLYKNPRDSSQISSLAKQISPGNIRHVVDIFRAATKKPHSYLLIDSHQKTEDFLRLRTNILPHESPVCIWMSTEQMKQLEKEQRMLAE